MVNRYTISRLLGIVFLLAGLMKLLDTRAFATVVAEYGDAYIGAWVVQWRNYIAVYVCMFEVIVGIAAMRRQYALFVSYLLIVCSIIFLYLTAVNYLSPNTGDSIASCGCFGEVVHLSPKQSFCKNLIMVILASLNIYMLRSTNKGDFVKALLHLR